MDMYGRKHKQKVQDLLKDKPLPGNNSLQDNFNRHEPNPDKALVIQKHIRGYQGRKLVEDKKQRLQQLILDKKADDDIDEDLQIATFALPKKY